MRFNAMMIMIEPGTSNYDIELSNHRAIPEN
jgi:hypothetical protein